jgi:glycosyltransferase involved in cell wall biosynthesis
VRATSVEACPPHRPAARPRSTKRFDARTCWQRVGGLHGGQPQILKMNGAASVRDSTPQISILIPAYNEELLIARVIDCVHASFANVSGYTYEIIVCDNNSTDGTARLATAKGAMVVHEPHNQIAKARNTAARHAQGRWLIFIDGDTFLNPELLKLTVAALESREVCGGGAVVRFEGEMTSGFGRGLLGLWNRISKVLRLAAGSYVFCDRQAWADVGGFDERVYAGEELYFSRRIKRWGKERGLKFVVFTEAPIFTSPRKMQWYSAWHLLGRIVLLARPGALKRRDRCGLWYERPA